MKRSKRIEANLKKIISLKSNPMASALELTRIEEDQEEDQVNEDRYISKIPPPTHSSPAPHISYDNYQDDCVTSKTPRIYDQNKEETSLIATEQREQEANPIATSTTDDEGAVEIYPVPSCP